MKNLNIIEVKCLPPTNTKGSRVKMTSLRIKESKTIPFNYDKNSTLEMAEEYLKEQGQKIVGQADGGDKYFVILDSIDGTFPSIK